jgi:aminodeoxyfutalosine deaminase
MTPWHTLPKVELHCHLLGVISPALLARIRGEGGKILVEPETLAAVYPVSDLDSFRRWVDILKPYQAAPEEAMRPLLATHISDLIAQRVVYTEIMLSPTIFPRERLALLEAFRRWREWAWELEQGRIQVEFLFVVPRTLDAELLKRDTVTALELRRAGLIAGVALVGVETGESIARFARSFECWREAGLGIEIHAGEHTGAESVWDALKYGRPDRLGHALSSFADPALLDHIRSAGTHMEFCLTSNVCTGAVADIRQHPIRTAKELGLRFSLNTDDPGAFECSVESEYRTAFENFAFDSDDFAAVFRNSLAARFEPRLRYITPSF